ncbi:MAG: iron-containing alcohol dehydrogenase [Euryarchaeota archaeon]|nr:iron-containing alcohol dehydrogenase [Euryarchaeota archaeon]
MKFHMLTEIIFGSGSISQLKRITEKLNATNPLIVTDKGVINAGIADKVLSQSKNSTIFDDVEENPKSTTVNRAGELVQEEKPDLIIGLGGGSSMDTAKAVALLATNPGKIEEYEGKGQYTNPPLPLLAIPTTCGTGSEVTWVSVITDARRKFKMSIKGPEMFPAAAIIDPDLICSLPKPLIASTGMDALTHAIEAYTVKPRTPITDIFAKRSIELIFHSLRPAYKNIKENKKARENLMLGSTLAGIAFGNSDVGSVHCLAETIGGLYNVPHGVANSIFLPYVMEFNRPAVNDRYAAIARLVGIKGTAEKLIEQIKSLSRRLHIPSFSDLNIEEDAFERIARLSVKNNSNPSNPREIDTKGYIEILRNAAE